MLHPDERMDNVPWYFGRDSNCDADKGERAAG